MKEPIRILHVIGIMNRGGAETMIMNIYRQIDKSKIQFDFVVHTDIKGDYDDEIIKLGGRIYKVPRFKGTNLYIYINAWKEFYDNHKEYKIVHGHIGSSAAIYLKIAKKNRMFTIAHSHSSGKGFGLKAIMYSILSFPTRYIADYFFGCSKDSVISRYGNYIANCKDRFHILENAINIDIFSYSPAVRLLKRKELGLDNKFVLGHVGRFDKAKNQSYLIDIFKVIYEQNHEASLILIGDGELRKLVEDKVKKLNLSENVMFLGKRTDIPELLQVIDVFVFPSVYEGLPVTLIEAQASGLPCIISDTITDEVKIIDDVKFISLEESPRYWAEQILEYSYGFKREDTFTKIQEAGYDVKENANWLQMFYLEEYNRRNQKNRRLI